MFNLQIFIQLITNVGIFYWGKEKLHIDYGIIYTLMVLYNILYLIGGKMYAKKTIKKEIIFESINKTCNIFTSCILLSSLIKQQKDDKVLTLVIMITMLLTSYFLIKKYNFSHE